LRNKVNTFYLTFYFKRNLFNAFSLIFFLLYTNSIQSQSKERYDSLLTLYYSSILPDDTVKVKLLYDLSIEASRIGVESLIGENGTGRNLKELRYMALELSLKLNYKQGIEQFYNALSSTYNQKTDLPILGFNDFEDGISAKKFKELHFYRNKKHFGSLDNYIGVIKDTKAKKIVEQNYRIEYWVGLIYFDWFNYKKAIKHFKTAAKSDGIRHDSATLSDVYQCIGASYFYKGNYDSSIVFYNKSLEIRNKNVSQLRTGICLTNLGEVYYRESDFLSALSYFKGSLNHFSPSSDSAYIAYALNEMGRTYTELKKFGLAENVLIESMNMSSHMKERLLFSKAYKSLSALYEAKGDYQKAYYYHCALHRIKDSLFVNEVVSFFKYNEEKWQNDIGREITKKESEALKRSETIFELKRSRLFLIIGGLIFISVIVISSYTYRLFKLKQKANSYLTELNRSREKLLSVISHDVRGPIIGFIDLLEPLNRQINSLSYKQISEHIEQVIDLSQSIKLLVDNLLEWTKAQQGLIKCHFESFPLIEAVYPNIDIYQPIAKSKGITLNCKVESEATIYADRNMMHVIIRNLLNNAVKFTKREGAITISTQKEGNGIVVSVTDTGIGMSNELMAMLFCDKNDYETKQRTSGLGLALCKEYVEQCGGKIWIESAGKDTGSKISFTVKSLENYG